MTIHVNKSEVLALMRKQSWKACKDYADIIEKNDKENEYYAEAQREYKCFYAKIRLEKLESLNRDKREFFMTYLYPSVRDFLDTFGITVDYMGWDSQTKKEVLRKGDTKQPLNFINGGKEIITAILKHFVIPMLEQKGIKGLKLSKKEISGGMLTDIFDFSEVTYEDPDKKSTN